MFYPLMTSACQAPRFPHLRASASKLPQSSPASPALPVLIAGTTIQNCKTHHPVQSPTVPSNTNHNTPGLERHIFPPWETHSPSLPGQHVKQAHRTERNREILGNLRVSLEWRYTTHRCPSCACVKELSIAGRPAGADMGFGGC